MSSDACLGFEMKIWETELCIGSPNSWTRFSLLLIRIRLPDLLFMADHYDYLLKVVLIGDSRVNICFIALQ
jgi:hypothetical protein